MKRQKKPKPESPTGSPTATEAIPPQSFTPELLDLAAKAKRELYARLSLNINSNVWAEILYEQGFRNNDGTLCFIRDHVIYCVTEQDLSQTLRYILSDNSHREKDEIFKKTSHLINPRALRFIEPRTDDKDGHLLWHHAHCFLFPYQNGVLKIGHEGLALIPYRELDCLVPVDSIIQRRLTLDQDKLSPSWWMDSDFYKLTVNQATDPETGEYSKDLHQAIFNGIARTLHLHFNQLDPCAVILSEQIEPNERNAGRTGKGIIIQAIAQLLGNPAKIDGKSFDSAYAHSLQAIQPDSRWVWVDETKDIEDVLNAFYSGLTGGLTVNPKNRASFTIPASRTPSVIITTNKPGFGVNDSDLARRFDLPLTRWYNAHHTPVDDFGRELFGLQWTSDDWSKFDLFAANICLKYLKRNYGVGRLPRCAKAKNMLREAALGEIDPSLREHFEQSYGDRMALGQSFAIIPTKDLEAFQQSKPAYGTIRYYNTRSYNVELNKWLQLQDWRSQSGRFTKQDGETQRSLLLEPKAMPGKTDIKLETNALQQQPHEDQSA